MSNFHQKLFQYLSPGGGNARLSVLIFHRVLPRPDPLFPDEMCADQFDKICGWIKGWFHVLSLDEAVVHMRSGTLPPRAASITFDDGYADNFHVARPILLKHSLCATFFIATGYLDGGRMWNDTVIETIRFCDMPVLDLSNQGLGRHVLTSCHDRQRAVASLLDQIKYSPPDDRIHIAEDLATLAKVTPSRQLMMTSQEVKTMHQQGMQIGAHTVSHPILSLLPQETVLQEVADSKRFLENLLDARVGLFAYPNGKLNTDYTLANGNIVRSAGFDAAFTTHWGAAQRHDDLFQIPRFTPWDRTQFRFGLRLLKNLCSSQSPRPQ